MSWWAIGVLAIWAYGCKFVGVFVLSRVGAAGDTAVTGAQRLIPAMAALIPAALFSALIAVQTLGLDGALRIDARVAGVSVGAVAAGRRAPFVVVVVVAMTVTAAVRWQTSR